MRTPYGRRRFYGGLARLIAERGYHVVCQSIRGTFGSGGVIDVDAEAADGRATADWMVAQPWSNGEMGGYGASYLSLTQWALAATRPPQLKAMAIEVMAAQRHGPYYPGGAFSLDRALTWTYLVSNQERSRLAGMRAGQALRPAFRHLPLGTADVAAVGHQVPFYRAWLEHDAAGDPYWAPACGTRWPCSTSTCATSRPHRRRRCRSRSWAAAAGAPRSSGRRRPVSSAGTCTRAACSPRSRRRHPGPIATATTRPTRRPPWADRA
jgi:predicted acyl esterase